MTPAGSEGDDIGDVVPVLTLKNEKNEKGEGVQIADHTMEWGRWEL